MNRKPLRSLAPGDVVLGVDPLNLVGPRGGRYSFRGMTATGPMTFTHTTLNPAGTERTFHFDGANGAARPLVVASALSCKLRARVQA